MGYSNNSKIKLCICGSLISFLFLVLFTSNIQAQCSGSNLIEDPQQFTWTYHPVTANNPQAYYSGVLEVGQASFTMNNGQTLTTRAYRQQGGSYSIPGPTIKVTPGNKYIIRLHNTLPYAPLSTSENVFKDPNATNIHTHGLHISGESPSDDVTRVFEGGRGGDFVWDIPANHMGGTYWYHAHHHGSSFLHVSGGLFGLLIVDDSNDGIPAPVASMPERQMVLGYLDRGAAGTGGDVLLSGTLSSTWTVNGKIGGNICMPANTWQHWRILLADRDAVMKTVSFGPECEVKLLARDGVWRTIAPKDLSTRLIELTGASRADIAIRITGNSTMSIGNNVVSTITANGTPNTGPHPYNTDGVSTWQAVRPNYLRNLRTATNVHLESVSMGARTINGSKYDHHNANITLPATQVQEWSLSGNTMHPFHLHIYHMQALSTSGDFEAGEYYDVVAAKMSVRFDLNANSNSVYSGRTIMHCHILDHEDQGAMGWLNVTGGLPAPTFPADGSLTTPYSAYYIIGGGSTAPAAPTNLVATAASSSSINLTWTDNSTDETGFHVERSTDGSNFAAVIDLGANVVSYSDNGLTASTTYYYRIKAFNGPSHSVPSNIASATTQASGGGTVMRVQNIVVTRAAISGGRYRGVATVTIYDSNGVPVSGASVTGSFSGPSTGSVTGTTNTSGVVVLNSATVKNPVGTWCFTVTNVVKTGATYNSATNLITTACESAANREMMNHSHDEAAHNFNLKLYPNPANSATTISFYIEEKTAISIVVFDMLGKRILTLADRTFETGKHQLNLNGQQLNNGTYVIFLKAGEHIERHKLTIAH